MWNMPDITYTEKLKCNDCNHMVYCSIDIDIDIDSVIRSKSCPYCKNARTLMVSNNN